MKLAGGLLLLTAAPAHAQYPGDQEIPPVNFPAIVKTAAGPEGIVPKGWKLEARAAGDLNGDKLSDTALVLHMAHSLEARVPFLSHKFVDWSLTMHFFTGEIEQVPPAFSALKIEGKPAYRRARAGEDVQLASRKVTIFELLLHETTPDSATFHARVSKGTYIRSLARDIAKALNTVGHVTMASWVGNWLFYVQHQFEDAHWARGGDWNFHLAAVVGSSYLKLPPILQWFSGNIGLHHVHHLCSRVPNYRLQACLDAAPELDGVAKLITLRESLGCWRLALWDERSGRLVGFRDLEPQPA